MLRRLRQALAVVFHVHDTPHRTALAFAIGVFIAFFPLLGIHTLLALGIGFLFRLNRAALLVGAWVNNPWTLAPLYLAGTAIGCLLLGVPLSHLGELPFGEPGFGGSLLASLRPFLWPYVVGNLVLGLAAGGLAYALLRPTLEARARRLQPTP